MLRLVEAVERCEHRLERGPLQLQRLRDRHLLIENRNHYVRDVSCGEDKSRIRTNPGIMARARSCALNILRYNGVPNIAKALWDGALNLNLVLNYRGL
ncbi:hypothetical protein GCM10011395_22810 [Sphingomonas psychrolutea]|uniref:Transposase n=1 Tax=Sphingomonas psychrolutea TaxID=1259676 RepID=A0ABQ1GWV3_9SPHN|nr:hypothetical protein GCM10011395_22810 [Sphingomonas psychrolutea]